MKSRDISTLDYLQVLQEEYMCALLRLKLYPNRSDKSYYEQVSRRKSEKIINIAERNGLPSILTNGELRRKYWDNMVPMWGLPKFVYNENNNNNKDAKFPFKGTMVELLSSDAPFKYGITERVDFDREIVKVKEDPTDSPIDVHYTQVRRLTTQETDRLFYYMRGNEFKIRGEGDNILIGVLNEADLTNNVARIRLEGETKFRMFAFDDIARIL